MMSSMANLARIGILAGSAALVSMEANVFYSRNDGASECRKNCQCQELKTAGQEYSNHEEDTNKPARKKSSPRMAPQFDGLNFYETLIASQR
ncbi:hypothetical protein CY35_01G061700 [Sphagnum magellanicum]|jgi:hypothetical protein|uniref:Uncharacterized protein n=1 Tax=Sphagnum jensenii TaxID=128206 RepID=A0ABP1A512_9BRYO|nr:hypothetical protein CY35_01G061700 [Sphagnum magellanicum]